MEEEEKGFPSSPLPSTTTDGIRDSEDRHRGKTKPKSPLKWRPAGGWADSPGKTGKGALSHSPYLSWGKKEPSRLALV